MKEIIALLHQGVLTSENVHEQNSYHILEDITQSISAHYEPRPVYLDDAFQWIDQLKKLKQGENFSLVFNLADLGLFRNTAYEPHVAAILEALQMPFTGSGSYTLAQTLDKYVTKLQTADKRIPTPKVALLDTWSELEAKVGFPCIVKKRRGWGSYGLSPESILHSAAALERKVASLNQHQEPLQEWIAEEYIDNPQLPEISCFFIGNESTGDMEVLPLAAYQFSSGKTIRDFSAKWSPTGANPGPPVPVYFPEIPAETRKMAEESTRQIAKLFAVRDYGRFDYRLHEEMGTLVPKIIDINANPDLNQKDSTFSLIAEHMGIGYGAAVERIIRAAQCRYAEKKIAED